MRELVKALQHDRRGAAALEYGMLVAVLSLIIMVGVADAGTAISDAFQSIGDLITAAA